MAFEKWEVRDSIRVFHQVMSVILLVVSVLMNVLLLLMLTRKRLRHRRTARSFICLVQNLAIANILVVLLGVPLDRVWHGPARYPFGAVGCKTIEPLRSTAFQAMIHMFVAVIVQRWYGIVHSLYGQLKFFHAVFICLAVWIVALCTSIPFVVTLQYLDSTSCFMEWNVSGRAYMVVLFVVQYLLPVLVMIALCISIKSRLKKYRVLDPERAQRRDRHNRMQRLFFVFIPLFTLLLLPKYVMTFIKAFGKPIHVPYFDEVFDALDLLTYCVTVLIPVLFIAFCPEFQSDLWVFLKCQCCRPSIMMNKTEISDSFSEESEPIGVVRHADDQQSASTPVFQTKYEASTPVFPAKYEADARPNGGSTSTAPEPQFDMIEASMFKSTLNRVATVDRRLEPSPSATPPGSDIFENPPPPPPQELDDLDDEML